MRVRLPLRAPISRGCGARAASRSFKPRIPVRVRASLPGRAGSWKFELDRPPNALADEQRSFKPRKQVRFLTGAPKKSLKLEAGRPKTESQTPPNALSDEHRPLKPGNQARFLAGAPDLIPPLPSPRPSPPRTVSGPLGGRNPILAGPVAQSADAAASRADVLEVQVLPGPPRRTRGATADAPRSERGGCGFESHRVHQYSAGGKAQSPRVPHTHVSSVQLGAPLPTFVRFFQQQDASLTSRRWGCDSLTGHPGSAAVAQLR